MKIPFRKSKKGITLKVKVEPRSSRKGISGLLGDTLKIRVNAPPVGGAANEELIEILSEELGIKKTSIKIVSGQSSRNKVVEIEGADSIS
ncbi:MAG: YggU family protein [Nitrospirae bacterium RBG_13_39_12]|nr:MAG: YggU family protein [Nitrospirae bacterium RBG_13_39_12]